MRKEEALKRKQGKNTETLNGKNEMENDESELNNKNDAGKKEKKRKLPSIILNRSLNSTFTRTSSYLLGRK
jgi:hypothetical protein